MKKQQEYFWSLSVEPGLAQAAIWTIEDSTTRVVAVGPSVKWEDNENLVDAADATLSSAVSSVQDDSIEPTKTVFGVSASWVEEGQIKKQYLDQLREVCAKLSLSPTGFVVLPEAIAHYVKTEEGTPLNAIVIGVADNSIDVAVFRLGNLVGTVNVIKSVSVVEDVVEGLARFATSDPLPSRFVIYNGKEAELEEVKQSLVKADWTTEYKDKLKFLHTPDVEIIDPQKKMIALSLAGASEMAEVTAVAFESPEEILPTTPDTTAEPEVDFENEEEVADAGEVGFVVNEDIAEQEVMEEDARLPDETDENVSLVEDAEIVGEEKHHATRKLPNLVGVGAFLSKLPFLTKSNKPKMPKIESEPSSIRRGHGPKVNLPALEHKPLVIGVGFLLALLVVGFAAWWFLPRAEITIYISPRQLEKREVITVDPAATGVDASSKILPATRQEIVVSGSKTAAATGSKVVGEKAKGSIQIRNGTAVGIKVNAGTTLFGPNNLKFVTDASASVSAALSPSTPGTVDVAVTAAEIGGEYNLGQGETMQVGNYPKSEVDAIIEESLSGGSSREITAVSADDLKNLEDELTAELISQGESQFAGEISVDQMLVTESISSSVEERSFSKKAGEEAANVELSLSLKLMALSIPREGLNQMAMEVLQNQVPGGFVLRQEQITTDFSPRGEGSDGKWEFDAHFTANLLPEVKTDDIAAKISGKNPEVAKAYLASIPGYSRVVLTINPSFPGKLAVLPHLDKNISISVTADR